MTFKPLHLRQSIAGKMLFITLGITILLIILTILIVNRQFSSQISQNIRENLQKSYSVYQSLQVNRLENLRNQSANVSTDFRLKATLNTDDLNTIEQARKDINNTYNFEIFWILNRNGEVIVPLPPDIEIPSDFGMEPAIIDAGNGFDSADIWAYQGAVYEVGASPILAKDKIIGIVFLGNRVDDALLKNVQRLIGISGMVYLDDQIAAASEPDSLLPTALPLSDLTVSDSGGITDAVHRFSSGDEEYIFRSASMENALGHPLGTLLFYQSWNQAIQPVRQLRYDLLIIGAGAILIAIIAGIFFVNRLAAPLQQLVEATEKIGRGQYETSIEIDTDDEIGYLAGAFERMGASLQEAQKELIRSERMSTVGQMASSIIHDFKQPITTIYGYSDLLSRADVSEGNRVEFAGIIQEEVDRMMAMVNELLEFSRGETKLHKQPIELGQFVRDIAKNFQRTVENKNIDIILDQHVDRTLNLDRDRMQRVMDNLLRNARDAMPGGGTISIRTEPVDKGVRILVEDTGDGIPPEVQKTLFDPFVTAAKKSGTGLGLAIVKQIVEHHDGSINYRTERHKGTCFSITLPEDEDSTPPVSSVQTE